VHDLLAAKVPDVDVDPLELAVRPLSALDVPVVDVDAFGRQFGGVARLVVD
jgi:hypothetical protein